MIVEEDFIESLKIRDELEEQLTNKKLKQNDSKWLLIFVCLIVFSYGK